MSSTLPKLHESGFIYANTKECKWWPDPDKSTKDVKIVEGADERYKETKINDINLKWLNGATNFLTFYVARTAKSLGGHTVALSNDGVVSAALEAVRNDRIIQESLEGLDDGTKEGLRQSHGDVLAAVALVMRIDRTTAKGVTRFRPEGFSGSDEAATK